MCSNPSYRKRWRLVHLPIILSAQNRQNAHKTQRKDLKTSNLAYTMLLARGQLYAKNMAFYGPIGCVRFARYCGKMYRGHLFPYGGLLTTD